MGKRENPGQTPCSPSLRRVIRSASWCRE